MKATHSHSTKSTSKRISSATIKSSQLFTILRSKNTKLSTHSKKLKRNGRRWISVWSRTRKPGKSKDQITYSQPCNKIWGLCQLRKQVYITKISKIRSNRGKTICKKYHKLCKCSFKFKDNGFIFKQFSHLSKTKIDS